MRYRVIVSRVQVAERHVRAADEEDAVKLVQGELERPYGFFGGWRTTNTDIDVVEAASPIDKPLSPLANAGPLLLSVKDAAKHLGITNSMLYEMLNNGEIHHVAIGRRKYVSREALKTFIEAHTHLGWFDRL